LGAEEGAREVDVVGSSPVFDCHFQRGRAAHDACEAEQMRNGAEDFDGVFHGDADFDGRADVDYTYCYACVGD